MNGYNMRVKENIGNGHVDVIVDINGELSVNELKNISNMTLNDARKYIAKEYGGILYVKQDAHNNI